MAGETIKAEAICLDIRPWSKTSHVVSWLTSTGKITTVVKGATRPKSAFLGQYDLNYTCEIIYYARARGEVHALRECSPLKRRDSLRDDFRSLVMAGYFRRLAAELTPVGPDAAEWFTSLSLALDGLDATSSPTIERRLAELIAFEQGTLELLGLRPELDQNGGELMLRGERKIPISAEVAACLTNPEGENSRGVLVDAARVIGVYYQFHVDCLSDVRRTVLGVISKPQH